MGIGRREFLQLFGTAIATLTSNPNSEIAIVDEQYVNRKLGIAFRKPPEWTFADDKEMGDVSAGQILDLDDPALARELIDVVAGTIDPTVEQRLAIVLRSPDQK